MKLKDFIVPAGFRSNRRLDELEERIEELRGTRDAWKHRAKTAEAALKKLNLEYQTDPHRARAILDAVVTEHSAGGKRNFPFLAGNVISAIDPEDDMIWSANTRAYFLAGLHAFEIVERASRFSAARPRRILDLPCGHGRVARFLRAWLPEAELFCCDLQTHGVEFCAKTFQAVPVVAHTDPDRIDPGQKMDLIWVGSLFTHLPEQAFAAFLRRLCALLEDGGLLVFTTHGDTALGRLVSGESYHLRECDPALVQQEVQQTGFSYRPYHKTPEYGVTFNTRDYVEKLGRTLPGIRFHSFEPAGWGGHQDVHVWGK